jgi:hypothetical protein
MTAPFFLGITLLLLAPTAGREKSYTGKDLSEAHEIRLKDDRYDALVISDIYANVIYVSTSETPGRTGEGSSVAIVERTGISRNTFRIDLTSLEEGTYYIHTSACYAMFRYKLVLK